METKMASFPSHEYNPVEIDGKWVMVPIRKSVSEKDILAHSTGSEILECIIMRGTELISNSTTYVDNIRNIWKTVKDIETLRDTTTWYIWKGDQGDYRGYNYWKEMGFSYCRHSAKETLREILKLCEKLKMTIRLTLKTVSGKIVYFSG